jgi:hypothetical protein
MQGCYPSSKMDLVKAITGGRLRAVAKKQNRLLNLCNVLKYLLNKKHKFHNQGNK